MKNKRQEEPEMTQKSHIIEIVIMIVAVLILIMTLFFFSVNAQQPAHAAGKGTNTTSDNTTTKSEALLNKGVPGKGINQAPGLQKPFNPNSNALQNHNRPSSDNSTFVPPISDNATRNRARIMEQREVHGEGNSNAPGLQKTFNQSAGEQSGFKKFLLRWQHRFQELFQRHNKTSAPSLNSD